MSSQNSGSLVRSISAGGRFVRKQLWIWPLAMALVLGVVGAWVRNTVEHAMKAKLAAELKTILNADVEALRLWLKGQQSFCVGLAADEHVRTAIGRLAEIAAENNASDEKLIQSSELGDLRNQLKPWLEVHGYHGFVVIGPGHRIIGAMRNDPMGLTPTDEQRVFLDKAFGGISTVSLPFRSAIVLADENGQMRAGLPTMFVSAPVRDDAGETFAVLALRIRPEADFTRILSVARSGKSGETYAFDANGLLISQSRFDDVLKQIGLIPDRDDSHSVLEIEIRDPGVDMTQGFRPEKRRSDQPLTRMAAAATAGEDGFDVDGYNDYRGVPVIGAWSWLNEYGFGVASEVDVAEAYLPLYILRRAFWVLLGLLAASAVALFFFMIVVARLQRSARHAELKAKQLGQYSLHEEIGSGGMGSVYRAEHAMLRRPTAVKLLDPEKTTDETIARFEREVQMTSQLNHPNTIAIYDYGRTPQGIFYYAMEYLDGVDLQTLIERFGRQGEGRVINILTQICGSLAEAHDIGLIHRDIKPANIMLNRRGGICDFVKVLDFGLVKSMDAARETMLTAANALTGTPAYLSPEAIEKPDAVDRRSDLYAVGAVGYFLLTGTPVFEGKSIVDVCMKHLQAQPERPSARVSDNISSDIEEVLLQCLAKQPKDRPQSAGELASALSRCQSSGSWLASDAEMWWSQNAVGAAANLSSTSQDTDVDAETTVQQKPELSQE